MRSHLLIRSTRPLGCLWSPCSARLYGSRPAKASEPSTSELIPPPDLPSIAPKPAINVREIRDNPDLYAQNCIDRNYVQHADFPSQIVNMHVKWLAYQSESNKLRKQANAQKKFLQNPNANSSNEEFLALKEKGKDKVLQEARDLKAKIAEYEKGEAQLQLQIKAMAMALPNTTSPETPIGSTEKLLGCINDPPSTSSENSTTESLNHVQIGKLLGILDVEAGATSSGYGFYYLVGDGALLEQALVSYALEELSKRKWTLVSPPAMVYAHIGTACGFQPRDHHGEQQVYTLTTKDPALPQRSMVGTSEISLAAMEANRSIPEASLPLKRCAVSRCYRAEAGGRGANTSGLYRVHEFTKVEMFAWTAPHHDVATPVFDEVLDVQSTIVRGLGLHARVLEMPSADLGASAYRKVDIEAHFPSRLQKHSGWGEVSSASICTDYQTRRLATKMKSPGTGTAAFPWTINGTALAVPRILMAIIENYWDEKNQVAHIPEVLRKWMGGRETIQPPSTPRTDP